MNHRGSVLIMFLWVLVLFALLSLSVAFRTRLSTKIESWESRRFERFEDVMTAVNLSRYYIERDENADVDSVLDSWYGIPLDFPASPYYDRFRLTLVDEESKLNLNKASAQVVLSVLEVLEKNGIHFQSASQKLAANIAGWRGDISVFGDDLSHLDDQKLAPYESFDELLLVPGVTASDVEKMKPYFTVYGPESGGELGFNLNTVQPFVLEGVIRTLPAGENMKQGLLDRMLRFRQKADREHPDLTLFHMGDLKPLTFMEKLGLQNSAEMIKMVGHFLVHATVDSRVFRVIVRDVEAGTAKDKPGEVIAEVILGPLALRASNVMIDESEIKKTFSPPVMVIPELEVLAWHENGMTLYGRGAA